MLKKLTINKKSKAQALVEFAIILTLLLTLIYGILETGRLMLIYGSTVTAARAATRYGSATGKSPAGIPYYKDCANIRAAAKNIGFLAPYTDSDIVISYDQGPNTADFITSCENLVTQDGATTDSCLSGALKTGDRVKTCVSTTWNPIVGGLVPLNWSGATNCAGVVTPNAITKRSERTILCGVSIGVVDPGTGPMPGTNGLALSCGASTTPSSYDHVGQVIKYTYKMTNSGSSDLKGSFTIAADRGPATCGAGYTIYPGKSYTCTGYYTVTQADLDASNVVNTATAYTSGASSLPCSNTVASSQNKKLTLAISAKNSEGVEGTTITASVGTVVTFTYTLTNTGNVTLTSPSYTLTDTVPPPSASSVTCPSPATLAPGGVITCTENYTITASDVTAGKLVNTATLAYTPPSAATQTTTASATVYTSRLILTVTTSVSPLTEGQTPPSATIAGQAITYNYILYNNSGIATTTAAPTIAIAIIGDSFTPFSVTCPADSIPIKGYMTCTPATYTVTQANIDAGIALTHTATAAANNGNAITSGVMTVSVPIVQNDKLAFTISATTTNITPIISSPTFPTVTAAGDTFTFNYTLTNTGNTTLASPYTITAPGAAASSTIRGATAVPLTVTCGTSELPPAYINSGVTVTGASTTCSSETMTVNANDLNGSYGSYYITNTAVSNAKTKIGARAVVSEPQTGLIATATARLNVVIKANLIGMRIQYVYTLTNTGNNAITLPASYSISTYTLIGTSKAAPTTDTTLVLDAPFICSATAITIAINSSFTCPIELSYPVTAAQYAAYSSITNTINTVTPVNPLVTSAPVTTPLTSACNVTGAGTGTDGRIPDAVTADANGFYKTTWNITNNMPATIVHINSIILTWATLGTEITNVSLTNIGITPPIVWSGKTLGSDGFFPISSDTNSSKTKPAWPLAFNSGTQTMELTFTKSTVQIRVQLGFSDPDSCYASAGLDSGEWP